MLGLAARLPDPLVGMRPGVDRRFDLVADQFPVGRRACAAQRFFVQVDRVEQRAPDVVLALVVGAVADPHRLGPAVAAEVVERLLGQLLLAADPVHDLQVGVVPADVDDEAHEVARLLVEAERVQRPEAEGRVADPAEAVVPVAFAAGRLGQRGGRRGEDRPGRRVGEALQDQRRALQVDAPGVVGEVAVAQPVAPELFGRVEPLERLGGAARAAQARRRPRSSRRSRSRPRAAAACRARRRPRASSSMSLVSCSSVPSAPWATASPSSPPLQLGRLGAVGEARQALHLHLDLAVDAGHRPQQRAVGLVLGLGREPGPSPARPTRRSSARRGRRPSRCRSPRSSRSPACPARSGG